MPEGLMYVLFGPTETCTHLPDHNSLTCAKPELLIGVLMEVNIIFVSKLYCCSYSCETIGYLFLVNL